jgi:hypothetical protein
VLVSKKLATFLSLFYKCPRIKIPAHTYTINAHTLSLLLLFLSLSTFLRERFIVYDDDA